MVWRVRRRERAEWDGGERAEWDGGEREGAAAARGRSGSVGRTGEGATAAASFFRDAQAEVMKISGKT